MKCNIIRLEETRSTNVYLRDLFSNQTVPEFTTVVTEYQSAGRGQMGNSWESEQGKNLLFSVLLQPDFVQAREQFLISQITSLAIKESLDRFAPGFSIKWPNDIYWNKQKICGMLIENDIAGMMLSHSILGIGININQEVFVSNAPNPISLKTITGDIQDKDEILADILHRLSAYYELLRKGEEEKISSLYFNSLFRKEGFYRYADKNGEFSAKITRIAPGGVLILSPVSGEERAYLFKEVRFIL